MSNYMVVGTELIVYEDNNSDIPPGATHFSETYDIISFYRIGISGYGVESGEPFCDWYSWNVDEWEREVGVRTTNFKKIEEYRVLSVRV